jgi:hypothetical protein
MDQWEHQMKLDGKPAVRCLHPIGVTDTANLVGKLLLLLTGPHMLDDRVAEYDVERLIGKGQQQTVRGDLRESTGGAVERRGKVEQDDARPGTGKVPDRARSAHVEDARFRGNFERSFEQRHAPRTEIVKSAIEKRRWIHWLRLGTLLIFALTVACNSRKPQPSREETVQAPASDPPASAHMERDEEKPYTIIEARHVIFHEQSGVRLRAEWLQGRLYPTSKSKVPSLDDPTSFKVEVEQGKTQISLDDLSEMLRNQVFRNSKLSGIRIRAHGPTQVEITGTLHEVVPLPVQLTGDIAATGDGRISIHINHLKVFKIPFKGMLAFMHLKPANLVHVAGKGVEAHGDSLYISTDALLPSPRKTGLITSVHCTADGELEEDYGHNPAEKPALADWDRSRWRNYIRLTGGNIQFGKLTMESADLTLLDSSPGDWFEFDLAHYHQQLVSGQMRMTQNGGLHVFVPDITKTHLEADARDAAAAARSKAMGHPSGTPGAN